MKTVKLYEIDAYQKDFEATVLSCEVDKRGFRSVISQTAFFPEGGGQPADTGTLSDVPVLDVQIENGEIYHYTNAPLETGAKISGEINFSRRFNFMQNHTAEHIVSGLVHRKFGFDNIGFHLNENEVTFDFNGFFTDEQLSDLELEANRRVWQNLKVTSFYPDEGELDNISYRAKNGIEGAIRLVEIENTDICACCAPHVKSTGEIGMIKFLSTEKQHGGTRIFMKCGGFALKDYAKKNTDIKVICEILSAKTEDVYAAVQALSLRLENQKLFCKTLNAQLLEYKIKCFDVSKPAIFCENCDIKDLQMLADGLHKAYGGVRTALCENGSGTAFVMCGDENLVRKEFENLTAAFSVKGGGRGEIRQGSIVAQPEIVKEYFKI